MKTDILITTILLLTLNLSNGQDIFNITNGGNITEDINSLSTFNQSSGQSQESQGFGAANIADILDTSLDTFGGSSDFSLNQFFSSGEGDQQQQQQIIDAEVELQDSQQSNQQQQQIDYSITELTDDVNVDGDSSTDSQLQQFDIQEELSNFQTFQDSFQNNSFERLTNLSNIIQEQQQLQLDGNLTSNDYFSGSASPEIEGLISGDAGSDGEGFNSGGRIINRLVETSIYGSQSLNPATLLNDAQGRVNEIFQGISNQGGLGGFFGKRRLLKHSDG